MAPEYMLKTGPMINCFTKIFCQEIGSLILSLSIQCWMKSLVVSLVYFGAARISWKQDSIKTWSMAGLFMGAQNRKFDCLFSFFLLLQYRLVGVSVIAHFWNSTAAHAGLLTVLSAQHNPGSFHFSRVALLRQERASRRAGRTRQTPDTGAERTRQKRLTHISGTSRACNHTQHVVMSHCTDGKLLHHCR